MKRFPTAKERYPRAGKVIEHPYCGTPDCCQSCEQLELFPVSIYSKDTKHRPASFPLDTITDRIDESKNEDIT